MVTSKTLEPASRRSVKKILVATDFSTRSDRALRRAVLLAKQSGAELVLTHVIDDDQPLRLLDAEQRESSSLLSELATTLQEIDGVACAIHLPLGEPFQCIAAAAVEFGADLILLGPHRRRALRDVFLGTTAERTIRQSTHPVIMANAVPSARYSRILAATDLSRGAGQALKSAIALGLATSTELRVLYAFEAPAMSMLSRAALPVGHRAAYVAEEEARAEAELQRFLHDTDSAPTSRVVVAIEASAACTIIDHAKGWGADLIVLGTSGQSGPGTYLLGSVAQEVLSDAEIDVMVVPPGLEAEEA